MQSAGNTLLARPLCAHIMPMSTLNEHKKAKIGRPPVDSEMVRSRLSRPLLILLDAYASERGVKRPEAIRLILKEKLER